MAKKEKLKIISLGGLNEVGKNITLYEYKNDIIVVDCGVGFPDNEMFGVDLVIPDTTYLTKNIDKVRAIVLTHGHEDHIGALPYVLRDIRVPVYGTRLTLGLLENKLEEAHLAGQISLNVVKPGDHVKAGCFDVELIRANHSIPDTVVLGIGTPVGMIVHASDFKIDTTPVQNEMMDLTRLGQLGKKGVLALLADSTNAERPGFTMSESSVGDTFDSLFKGCNERIIVTTFASNVHRIQQIIDAAHRYGRKVAISGRSMENIMAVAQELGYVNVPKGTLIDLNAINNVPKNKLVIVTTGSQGEPMSALYRIAFSDHRKIDIIPGDMVIISASAIPGNEKLVTRVINELLKKKANVVYESLADVHVSGHACQEELKIIMALTKPKFFIPIHGEYRHMKKNAALAELTGINPKNILISDVGKTIELDKSGIGFGSNVPSGRIMVDGLGVGDVGNIVLRDRKHLSQDGLIVVVSTIDSSTGEVLAGPDIVSRGFVYVREAETLMEQVRGIASDVLYECEKSGVTEWNTIKTSVKNELSKFLYEKTKRRPMILPVIMEV